VTIYIFIYSFGHIHIHSIQCGVYDYFIIMYVARTDLSWRGNCAGGLSPM